MCERTASKGIPRHMPPAAHAVRSPVEVMKLEFMPATYTHGGRRARGPRQIESNSCRFGTVLHAAPAHADVYDNKSLPLYVETPAGFAIRSAAVAGFELALRIDPSGDFPRRVPGETVDLGDVV